MTPSATISRLWHLQELQLGSGVTDKGLPLLAGLKEAIAARLDTARRRGLWHPRRNDVDAGLAALMNEGTR